MAQSEHEPTVITGLVSSRIQQLQGPGGRRNKGVERHDLRSTRVSLGSRPEPSFAQPASHKRTIDPVLKDRRGLRRLDQAVAPLRMAASSSHLPKTESEPSPSTPAQTTSENLDPSSHTTRRTDANDLFEEYGISRPSGWISPDELVGSEPAPTSSTEAATRPCHGCESSLRVEDETCLVCGHDPCRKCTADRVAATEVATSDDLRSSAQDTESDPVADTKKTSVTSVGLAAEPVAAPTEPLPALSHRRRTRPSDCVPRRSQADYNAGPPPIEPSVDTPSSLPPPPSRGSLWNRQSHDQWERHTAADALPSTPLPCDTTIPTEPDVLMHPPADEQAPPSLPLRSSQSSLQYRQARDQWERFSAVDAFPSALKPSPYNATAPDTSDVPMSTLAGDHVSPKHQLYDDQTTPTPAASPAHVLASDALLEDHIEVRCHRLSAESVSPQPPERRPPILSWRLAESEQGACAFRCGTGEDGVGRLAIMVHVHGQGDFVVQTDIGGGATTVADNRGG